MKPVILCDLDGVVWLAHRPIPGSAEAVADLRAAGHRVLFVTNNSSATVGAQEQALAFVGIDAHGDVVTSALSAAHVLSFGERVLVCGGPGIHEAVGRVGAEVVSHDDADRGARVDSVLVGFHRDFDYEIMRRASSAVRSGARLVGTNDDPTYPTPEGPIPGGGSILAAISTASGRLPLVTGKPYPPMAELVRAMEPGVNRSAVVVGDRPSTDGVFAATLGCRYALVRSGVTAPHLSAADEPTWFAGATAWVDVADLAAVARAVLGE
ncbi:MAG: HAD-IIA family hydrolase [Actinobacteria bacterium]|nr:HAD-IIA family hydrolase [Actinomycetota bacterium]